MTCCRYYNDGDEVMHATPAMVLTLILAASAPAQAQDETADTPIVVDEELVQNVPSATPSLEEIAASDPALSIREGQDGEADAMVMLSEVLFGFGDDTLQPEALDVLAGIATSLEDVPLIRIKGHTDAIGSEEDNRALGQRRADNVRDWLVANTNLTADMITSIGVGEADPIAENVTADGADNPEGRALNRRVEFSLPDVPGQS